LKDRVVTEAEHLPLNDVDAIVAEHNVAGAGGVLNAVGEEMERYIERHYAARGVDHLPYIADNTIRQFVLTTDPPTATVEAHIRYRQSLSGISVTPIVDLSELRQHNVQTALHLPYIRLKDRPAPEGITLRRYGLPPAVSAHLKNKADVHAWLMDNGFANQTPNHITCTLNDMPRLGRRMMDQIADTLVGAGMRDTYPLGLMIRSALSDGNYGMGVIVEAGHDMEIDGHKADGGQFILKPDGKTKNLYISQTLEGVLERLKDHIEEVNDTSINNVVVMTRLIDVDVSPGLCATVTDGKIHPFPFNGQYMEPGHTACTGTWTFSSSVGISRAGEIAGGYQQQTQDLLRDILALAMPNGEDVYAMLNIDVMVAGPQERELWARIGDADEVGRCNDSYRPRALDPGRVIFSEINPRDTNWTAALKAVLQARKLPCTIPNLKILASGKEMQMLTLDHWHLPDGIDLPTAYNRLLEFHRRLERHDEGFILRLADNPAGVIVYTTSPYPERLREITRQAYDFLEQGSFAPT
jgi:hypothetical protein